MNVLCSALQSLFLGSLNLYSVLSRGHSKIILIFCFSHSDAGYIHCSRSPTPIQLDLPPWLLQGSVISQKAYFIAIFGPVLYFIILFPCVGHILSYSRYLLLLCLIWTAYPIKIPLSTICTF